MKILFEKGDIVARPLLVIKNKTDEGFKGGRLLTFVGRSAEEQPTENPNILSDVVIIPAKEEAGKTRFVGDVDFTDGWEDITPATEKPSEYHFEIGDAEVVRGALGIESYLKALKDNDNQTSN